MQGRILGKFDISICYSTIFEKSRQSNLVNAGLKKVTLALAAVFVLGACTTTTITPELVLAPKEIPQTIIVGDVSTDYELLNFYLPHLRHGLTARLMESQKFEKVLTNASNPMPPSALVISGKLTEVDKGSQAARWLIGFGAGRAKARGMFEIKDRSGVVLARFESRKAYSGGAGIGGIDFIDIDELVQQLGEETAESLIRWSQGKPLKPPVNE